MKKIGKIKTLALASISAIALAAPIAFAQTGEGQDNPQQPRAERRGHGKHHGWGRKGGFGFRGLNLSEDQQARIKQLRESYRERTQSLHEQLRAKREELRQAEQGTTFNEALAAQKLTEAAGLEAKLMGERFRLRQEMHAVLTPEQKTQLEQRREQRKQMREQFRGRRGARRGGEQSI